MTRHPRPILFGFLASVVGFLGCQRPGPKTGEFDMPNPSPESMLIIPCPREWTPRPGILKIHGRLELQANVDRTEARIAVEIVRGGWPDFQASSESSPKVVLGIPGTFEPLDRELQAAHLSVPEGGGDEAYLIDIRGDRVVLAARGTAGLTYGALTLLQMVQVLSDLPTLPAGTLRDWPAFALRGVIEDFAAGQVPTVEGLKQTALRMSRLKLNACLLNLEDAYRYEKHLAVGKGRPVLLRSEVREIAAYAADLNVRWIPVFPATAHLRRILSAPECARFAAGNNPDAVDPDNPEAVAFLESLLEEIADAFPSDLVVLRAAGAGGKAEAALLARLSAVLSGKGKKTAVLLDAGTAPRNSPGRVEVAFPPAPDVGEWPRDRLLLVPAAGPGEFRPDRPDPVLAPIRRLGFPVGAVTGLGVRPVLFPFYRSVFDDQSRWSLIAFRDEASAWLGAAGGGETGEMLRELNLRGVAFTAECAWNPKAVDLQFFRRKFTWRFHGCSQPEWEELFAALETIDDDLGPPPAGEPAQTVKFFEDPVPFVWTKPEADRIEVRATQLEKSREWLRRHRAEHAHHEEAVLDYLDHALDRAVLLMDMLRVRATWGKELQSAPHPSAATRDRVRKVAVDLQRYRDRYQALWLRSNRPEGLAPNVERFEKLVSLWLAATTK